jgi:hypothetical protein
VIRQHIVVAGQICDRSCHTPDAIVSANRKAEPMCRSVQQTKPGAIQAAVTRKQRGRQFGVRASLVTLISFLLPIPRRDDPASYGRRRLADARLVQRLRMQRWNFDAEIDAIAERTGKPVSISIDVLRRTAAFPVR